eukprot:6213774-Pleurochrysis_carterae.AAC.2
MQIMKIGVMKSGCNEQSEHGRVEAVQRQRREVLARKGVRVVGAGHGRRPSCLQPHLVPLVRDAEGSNDKSPHFSGCEGKTSFNRAIKQHEDLEQAASRDEGAHYDAAQDRIVLEDIRGMSRDGRLDVHELQRR